jgi:hypothetical protein
MRLGLAGVVHRHQVLAAVLDPFHRPNQPHVLARAGGAAMRFVPVTSEAQSDIQALHRALASASELMVATICGW